METYKGARTLSELKEFVTTTKGEAGKAEVEDGKVGTSSRCFGWRNKDDADWKDVTLPL